MTAEHDHDESGIVWNIIEMICYTINVILILVTIYFPISQWHHNREMYMQKRSLLVYYSLNISIIVCMICLILMDVAFHFKKVPLTIIDSCAMFAVWFFVYIILVKNWMIFYKYKWTFYTMQLKWSHIINSESSSSEDNWFIKNNTKYGNLPYIYKLFGIYYIVFSIISVTMIATTIMTDWNLIALIVCSGVHVIAMSAIALFYLYIVVNTPYLNDTYQIHWESRIHSKLLLSWSVSCAILLLFFLIFRDFEIWLVGHTVMNVCLFLMVYVSTALLAKKQNSINMPLNNPRLSTHSSSEWTVDSVLHEESTLNAFMAHLSREYSMEILLSFIEFTQFQMAVTQKMDEHGVIIENNKNIEITQFPSNIPQSAIVHTLNMERINETDDIEIQFEQNNTTNQTDSIDEFIRNAKICAHELFKKYIREFSEFEINISAMERQKMSDLLENLEDFLASDCNLQDLLYLFEYCKGEMKMLQNSSLTRFKNDPDATMDSR